MSAARRGPSAPLTPATIRALDLSGLPQILRLGEGLEGAMLQRCGDLIDLLPPLPGTPGESAEMYLARCLEAFGAMFPAVPLKAEIQIVRGELLAGFSVSPEDVVWIDSTAFIGHLAERDRRLAVEVLEAISRMGESIGIFGPRSIYDLAVVQHGGDEHEWWDQLHDGDVREDTARSIGETRAWIRAEGVMTPGAYARAMGLPMRIRRLPSDEIRERIAGLPRKMRNQVREVFGTIDGITAAAADLRALYLPVDLDAYDVLDDQPGVLPWAIVLGGNDHDTATETIDEYARFLWETSTTTMLFILSLATAQAIARVPVLVRTFSHVFEQVGHLATLLEKPTWK